MEKVMKKNLLGDTVLRRDGDQLYLMNKQEGGFRAWAQPIDNEQWLLDRYHVRLGEWDRDEHGAFCPVTCIPRNELPTLHDGEEVPTLHDFGQRGGTENSTLVHDGEALKALMGGHIRSHVLFTDGYKLDHSQPFPEDQLGRNGSMVLVVGGSLTLGSRDPEASAMKVSKHAYKDFVEDTDWDAISDALGPDD